MKISSSIVRYIFPGILLFILILITFTEAKELLLEHINNKTILSIIFIIITLTGVILHHLYHLFYTLLFTKLQDKFRIASDSYRTYLSSKYGITTNQAMSLFIFLRDKYFKEIYTEKMETSGAIIHLMYLLFLLCCIFIIINLYLNQNINAIPLLLIGLCGLLLGFFLDRKYEERELHFIKDIEEEELNSAVDKLFNIKITKSTIMTF